MEQKASIGRIVIYKTTEADRQRMSTGGNVWKSQNVVDALPAVIVKVWSDTCVNLKVLGDGVEDYWKISIIKGDGQGNWNFPVKV